MKKSKLFKLSLILFIYCLSAVFGVCAVYFLPTSAIITIAAIFVTISLIIFLKGRDEFKQIKVNKEQLTALKDVGMPIGIFSRPSVTDAFVWLRKNKGLLFFADIDNESGGFRYEVMIEISDNLWDSVSSEGFSVWEEMELDALDSAIELLTSDEEE
jgi:hypothetical protein